MIYDKELVLYKKTKFPHTKGLITFDITPGVKEKKQKLRLCDRIMQQIKHFTYSIHGVRYIWEKALRLKIRIFWLLVLMAAIINCAMMYTSLANRHSKQQIKTVVETSQYPIYKINFPAVAICPWDNVNWLRYSAAEEKFLPSNTDENLKKIFYDVLLVMNDMSLSMLDDVQNLKGNTPNHIIDNISLSDLANFVAFRCDELFVECIFEGTVHDCCKIFVPERTEKGICMVFNSRVSDESKNKQLTDAFYPWKIRKAGEGTGLQFTIRFNKSYQRENDHMDVGIDVMIKESETWSQPLTHFFLPHTKNYLSITPTVTETSKDTRRLSPQKRRCLFANEKSNQYDHIQSLPFNRANCYVKCQEKNMIKICNCSMSWFFPKTDGVRECTVHDFRCIYENRDIFSYIKSPLQDLYILDNRRGLVCDCIDSCYSLVFLIGLNAIMLPKRNHSYPLIQGDIYIGQGVVTKYEARLDYTAFDLVAQFGGILGLWLGASVLSLAEVIYAFLKIMIIVVVTKYRQRKLKPKRRGKLHEK